MDSSTVLSWSADSSLRVWNLETGTMKLVLEGHAGRISGVAVLGDGKLALSWSADSSLQLWDLQRGVASALFVSGVSLFLPQPCQKEEKLSLRALAKIFGATTKW
jgi:WD40 repeat protein